MSEYGVFANVVAIAGSLAAAAGAIGLAWMRRARWQPPEEAVSQGTAKVAGLVSMVAIALLYAFGADQLGKAGLARIALIGLGIVIVSLSLTTLLSVSRTFQKADKKILGGFRLTAEARRVQEQHQQSEQEMLDTVRADKVWTRGSIALCHMLATLGFTTLIASGTISLAAAANLVALMSGGMSQNL